MRKQAQRPEGRGPAPEGPQMAEAYRPKAIALAPAPPLLRDDLGCAKAVVVESTGRAASLRPVMRP